MVKTITNNSCELVTSVLDGLFFFLVGIEVRRT